MENILTVYLCGGIFQLTDSQCKGWREEAGKFLGAHGIAYLDPMRRDYRGREIENIEALVREDEEDIQESDILLVNAAVPSWGTAMEIMYAKQVCNGKSVIAFNVPERVSPWLYYHTDKRFDTLEEALDEIQKIAPK